MNDVQQAVDEYKKLALAWGSERNSKKANRIFDKLHALALVLRESPDGRQGLESLLDHENRGVRLKAGSDCLAWGSAEAVAALEALVQPRGFHSLDAEMTLREYRAGRMRFDW